MKLKTIELTGLALRWATMKACKLNLEFKNGQLIAGTRISGHTELDVPYEPDIDWDQGGPIVDRFDLELMRRSDPDEPQSAFAKDSQKYGVGSTKLIAAMRCVVAEAIGDEVDVPDLFLGN